MTLTDDVLKILVDREHAETPWLHPDTADHRAQYKLDTLCEWLADKAEELSQ